MNRVRWFKQQAVQIRDPSRSLGMTAWSCRPERAKRSHSPGMTAILKEALNASEGLFPPPVFLPGFKNFLDEQVNRGTSGIPGPIRTGWIITLSGPFHGFQDHLLRKPLRINGLSRLRQMMPESVNALPEIGNIVSILEMEQKPVFETRIADCKPPLRPVPFSFRYPLMKR